MRSFRTFGTPILLLLLVGLLFWGARWGFNNLTKPLPTPEPTPCVTQSTDMVRPADVVVRIYNGGYTAGLGERVRAHFEEAGFQTRQASNTEEAIVTTMIRTGQAQKDGAELVKSHFKDATVELDDRVDGYIDIYVGTEYSGFNEEPMGEVPASNGQWCAVASPSPSPSASGDNAGQEQQAEGEGEPQPEGEGEQQPEGESTGN